jgi:hypothetical protein
VPRDLPTLDVEIDATGTFGTDTPLRTRLKIIGWPHIGAQKMMDDLDIL